MESKSYLSSYHVLTFEPQTTTFAARHGQMHLAVAKNDSIVPQALTKNAQYLQDKSATLIPCAMLRKAMV
jgi:hypothetical protein